MPPVAHILTGHFHETRGYDTWRARGADNWLLVYTEGGAGRFGRDKGALKHSAGRHHAAPPEHLP